VTTGASNDIQRTTELARSMVTKWGLSDKLGPLTYSDEQEEVFLGHSVAQHKHVSDETAHDIDKEIRSIIDRSYARAEEILKTNIDKLHTMAEALMKYETIDSDQIDDIMNGKPPRPPQNWDDTEPTAPTGSSTGSQDEDDTKEGKIGGPAGQH
jgi:cell division protease FtsH